MSRDWTPRELHLADEEIFALRGHHLYEGTFSWIQPDGTKIPWEHKDRQYKKYHPTMAFLGEGIAYRLIDDECVPPEIVRDIEDILKVLVDSDKGGNLAVPVETEKYPKKLVDMVVTWYEGLSTGNICYDHHRNNEQFIEDILKYMKDKISEYKQDEHDDMEELK